MSLRVVNKHLAACCGPLRPWSAAGMGLRALRQRVKSGLKLQFCTERIGGCTALLIFMCTSYRSSPLPPWLTGRTATVLSTGNSCRRGLSVVPAQQTVRSDFVWVHSSARLYHAQPSSLTRRLCRFDAVQAEGIAFRIREPAGRALEGSSHCDSASLCQAVELPRRPRGIDPATRCEQLTDAKCFWNCCRHRSSLGVTRTF